MSRDRADTVADSPQDQLRDDRLLQAFTACRGMLTSLIGRIVKGHEIDDVLQESYLRTLEASRRISMQSPEAYLMRTARNVALNHCKHSDNKRTSPLDDYAEDLFVRAEQDFDENVASEERFINFCRVVRRLPTRCRHVIILKMVYGLRQREIAERLNISESTVEKHIANGLISCRDAMQSIEHGDNLNFDSLNRSAGRRQQAK